MRDQRPQTRRLELIFLLWSLLFTKCFSLEYLVRVYEVPINSLYYVWCLSVTMATVATVVYAQLEKASIRSLLFDRIAQVRLIAMILTTASVLWSLKDVNADSSTALLIASLLMGVRQLFSLTGSDPSMNWLKGLAWGFAALAIFFVAPPAGYLLFAFALLLISVIPRATDLLRKTEK